jgi:tripeptide aminopeptidase
MINKRRLFKTFKQLVKIDSPSLHEGEMVRFVQKELKAIGIRCRQSGKIKDGDCGNLVAFLPGKGPRIILNAHLDTVSPGKKIKIIEKAGVFRSDGTTILGADNKAGVAAILEILAVLKEKRIEHPSLKIIFTVAEEIGLVGAKALPEKELRADFGLVLDGGDIDVVINKAPTQYNIIANITGRAAHAGIHPEHGINAIKVASEAVAAMKLGRIDRETTANIGIIKGGKATNIIPDEAELRGEARSHHPGKLRKQIEHMESVLLCACQKHRARLKIKVERVYHSFEIKEKNRWFSLIIRAIGEIIGPPIIKQTGGGSDANIFNERGIPAVILGVGADHVHTTREQLRVTDFVRGTENILHIIRRAAAWKKK